MAKRETKHDEPTWFDRLEDIVKWRVKGPRAYNPFGGTISTPLLEKFASDKSVLLRYVVVRGLVDGYEVVCVKNAKDGVFESDHLIVRNMDSAEMQNYFARTGLYEWLDQEISTLQITYQQELARRRAEKAREEPKEQERGESLKTIRERREREQLAKDARQNSIYSGGGEKNPLTEH
jgi:hypothetical protein